MKHIGLVLSGGMGKGAYQIGALTAISEFFKPDDFEYASAASVGVLNTYAFLTNSLQNARDCWESVDPKGNKRFIASILKSQFLQDIITTIASVEDKTVPNTFYAPLLDLNNKELRYYNFHDIDPTQIKDYLRASVAMPYYNKGITIDSHTLYDGAVVDNIPIYPVLKNDLDYVICIYFDDYNYIFENYSSDNKIVKLTFPDDKFISNSVNINHDAILYMMEHGYNRTKEILSKIFANGTDDLDFIYEQIAKNNETSVDSKKMVRITGDVIVTNMNKVIQKMIKRKKILDENNTEIITDDNDSNVDTLDTDINDSNINE